MTSLNNPPSHHERLAIIVSRWNASVTDRLLQGAVQVCNQFTNILTDTVYVPGVWEIPVIARRLAITNQYAAIIALGCVVRGQTRHFEHVADTSAQGLMDVQVQVGIPVLNGVLAVNALQHALARAGGSMGNKGQDVALAALEMIELIKQLP